ncbi:MAG: sugar phosphate isomerase/epimerase [Bryobacterales bacterium]|nr:sugar phosphate isomerase/epimerase [Bryobacterales bacterium]
MPFPLGINTYSVRAMRWHDARLLDYAASLKCDAIFLQDSPDPDAQNPAHWPIVKRRAEELGLHLETGGGATLPRTPEQFEERVAYLKGQIRRAAALGSPIVRTLTASDRYALPPGPTEQHIATMVRVLKAVRNEAIDHQVKVAIEVHKELQAWEFVDLVEEAGRDFVGIYLDTGNPVFVMEHPLTTVETLGKYALTLHLRDSVVYEHPKGIAVQWVPLGEGTVDFKEIVATAGKLCPHVHIYAKPITGRPPVVIPVWDEAHWKKWFPRARSADFARFVSLAKQGAPYARPMVVEDLQGRATPPEFAEAVQFQQREHLERSLRYARETLGLGRRWRTA